MSSYRIHVPSHLTSYSNIDHLLNNDPITDAVLRNYTELLQAKYDFAHHYPNEHSEFKTRYEQTEVVSSKEKKIGEQMPLFQHIFMLNVSPWYRQAVAEFWYLFSAWFVYTKIKESQASKKTSLNPSQTYSGLPTHDKTNVSDQLKQFSRTVVGSIPKGSIHSSSKVQEVVVDDRPVKFEGRIYYPETSHIQLQNLSIEQGEDIKKIQRELKEKTQEVDELRTRLSNFASKQLVDGNPHFTDLSDKNRPTSIAEKFHRIYDDEWTSSLESLTHAPKGSISLSDEESITFLMDLIKSIYSFCSNFTEKQIKILKSSWNLSLEDPFTSAHGIDSPSHQNTSTVPESVIMEFKQKRKVDNKECILKAKKNFRENVLSKNPQFQRKRLPAVDSYVDKCVEVIWIMCIQDPPMCLCWPEPKEKFNNDHYKVYCKKGTTVKLAVWPAVFLNKGGPLMDKGFALPM